MAKPRKIEHVKFVTNKKSGREYPYFNTGQKRASGAVIYARLPALASPDFWPAYAAQMAARTKRAKGTAYTIRNLCHDYERSKFFAAKAPNTQTLYSLTIKRILAALGDYPVDDLQKEDLDLVLENDQSGPGAHNIFLAVLGILYRYARRKGLTKLRPTEDLEKMDIGEHEAWPEQLVEAGLAADHARTRLAIHLLFFTGQRIGDVCKMRWSDIRGDAIFVLPQKTRRKHKTPLRIPLLGELRTELERTPKRGLTIITNHLGQPMGDQVIRREIKKFGAAHGHDVVPHGLRKNAVIALLEAGCTVAETAAITGQSFQMVEYYARQVDQRKLGSAAILKLENRRGTGKPAGKPAQKASNPAGSD